MKSYRARPTPFFTTLFSSWITKIAVLTLLIIGTVVYDYQRRSEKIDSAKLDSARSSSPVIANSTPSQFTKSSASAVLPPPESDTTTQPASAAKPADGPSRFASKSALSRATGVGSAAPAPLLGATAFPAGKRATAKPILRVTFYEASRSAIQDLQRESQSAAAGEAVGGVAPAKKVQSLAASGELKSISASRFQEYDAQNPVVIFKGQRSGDPTKNVGLYFQITPIRQDAGTLNMEVKGWGNVRLQDADENLFSSEMTLLPQTSAFVAGFLPRDKAFTDDDKAFLDSDPTLKIYNHDEFLDGSSDLIMVVEMVQTP